MIFTLTRWLQCFPTQENLTTKTLNPKVSSFAIQVSLYQSSPQKTEVKHLNSTQWQTKSRRARENRATVQTYDPRYDSLIQKSRHASTESRHDFASAETIHSAKKIAARHSKSRHDFEFHRITILSHFSTVCIHKKKKGVREENWRCSSVAKLTSRLGHAACCTDRSRLRQVVIFGLFFLTKVIFGLLETEKYIFSLKSWGSGFHYEKLGSTFIFAPGVPSMGPIILRSWTFHG